jgi:hypothetical protein
MDKKELTRRLLLEAGLTEETEELSDPSQVSDFTVQKPRGTREKTRLLLILDLPEKNALPIWRELCSLVRFGFQVDALVDGETLAHLKGHAPFGNVYGAEHSFAAENLASLGGVIVAPSRDLLARLALGLQDKPAAKAVLQALWRGLDVYMLEGAAAVDSPLCKNAALRVLYASYRDILLGMGVKPVFPPYLAAMLDRRQELFQSPQRETEKSGEKKKRLVVTEKDVLVFDKGSQWVLPGDAVVTSLAKEAAEKRGLLLKKNVKKNAQRAGEE